jgi:hypothetical protein
MQRQFEAGVQNIWAAIGQELGRANVPNATMSYTLHQSHPLCCLARLVMQGAVH